MRVLRLFGVEVSERRMRVEVRRRRRLVKFMVAGVFEEGLSVPEGAALSGSWMLWSMGDVSVRAVMLSTK